LGPSPTIKIDKVVPMPFDTRAGKNLRFFRKKIRFLGFLVFFRFLGFLGLNVRKVARRTLDTGIRSRLYMKVY